jgi:hypothetical protein
VRPPEDDDFDRDDEDRPIRKRGRKSKKKQGNMVLLLSCIGGGVAFLLAVFAVTAFAWPGFLRSRAPAKGTGPVAAVPQEPGAFPKGTGNEDLLAFAPPDANLFVGLNLGALQAQAGDLQAGISAFVQQAGAPPELVLVLKEADRLLAAANVNNPGASKGSFIFGMRASYDPERFRQMLKADKAETIQGKTVYRLANLAKADPTPTFLYMPNDRVLVFVEAPQHELPMALKVDGVQPVVAADVVSHVRGVDKGFAWAAFPVNAQIQQKLAQIDPNQLAMFPDLQPALPAIQQLKAASFAVEQLPAEKFRLRINAAFANAAHSQQLSTALQNFWQKQGKGFLTMGRAMAPPDMAPTLGPLLDEVANSLRVTASGTTATVTVEVSSATVQAFAPNVARLRQMVPQGGGPGGPGIRPAPGPGGRPPVPRPPRRPQRP